MQFKIAIMPSLDTGLFNWQVLLRNRHLLGKSFCFIVFESSSIKLEHANQTLFSWAEVNPCPDKIKTMFRIKYFVQLQLNKDFVQKQSVCSVPVHRKTSGPAAFTSTQGRRKAATLNKHHRRVMDEKADEVPRVSGTLLHSSGKTLTDAAESSGLSEIHMHTTEMPGKTMLRCWNV